MRRNRYTVDVYYTRAWNYSYDDVERGFTSIRYADVNNIRSEYNYSNIDEPHQFLLNGNYFLRYGFEIGMVMRFTSGRPYTGIVGSDINRDGQNTDRPIVDGLMLKRNTFRNTGFKDISLRMQKNFAMGEKSRLSVSAELFNIANFSNVQLGGAAFTYGPNALPLPSFGQQKNSQAQYYQYNVAGDPFQAQLGLRFAF